MPTIRTTVPDTVALDNKGKTYLAKVNRDDRHGHVPGRCAHSADGG